MKPRMSSWSVIKRFRWDDPPLAHDWTLFLPIYPVIVDTNILISDMIEAMTKQQPSRLLSLARLGKARFFAGAHVDGL